MADDPMADASRLAPFRAALYDFEPAALAKAVESVFATDALVQLAFPFETLDGPTSLIDEVYGPLAVAWPDLERRDTIVIAGRTGAGNDWIGCCGYYPGTFANPWMDIPPTGHQVAMRFHEFYRVVDDEVVETQALWDIPEVMMQAGAWPMAPSLGRDWQVPGPATQDGLVSGDSSQSQVALDLVIAMLTDMGRHPSAPPEAMQLDKYWHPKFSWYGPAGIGTARGVDGFRRHHQIPFLNAMPDRRGGYAGEGHFFAEGNYVGVTGWPGMAMTLTGDGWLGIAANSQPLTMRSLDFWRLENDESGNLKIRENWVLVDLLSVWDQLGVDVFQRMRELAGTTERKA